MTKNGIMVMILWNYLVTNIKVHQVNLFYTTTDFHSVADRIDETDVNMIFLVGR